MLALCSPSVHKLDPHDGGVTQPQVALRLVRLLHVEVGQHAVLAQLDESLVLEDQPFLSEDALKDNPLRLSHPAIGHLISLRCFAGLLILVHMVIGRMREVLRQLGLC